MYCQFFCHCALISIFLGKGEGRASIVSYSYTMQILSNVFNHLLLVFPTSNVMEYFYTGLPHFNIYMLPFLFSSLIVGLLSSRGFLATHVLLMQSGVIYAASMWLQVSESQSHILQGSISHHIVISRFPRLFCYINLRNLLCAWRQGYTWFIHVNWTPVRQLSSISTLRLYLIPM